MRPGCLSPIGRDALDEQGNRRGSERNRPGDEQEAQRDGQEGEVVTVLPHDLAEHECRRAEREHDRPHAQARRKQGATDGVGDAERDACKASEQVDEDRPPEVNSPTTAPMAVSKPSASC